MSTTSRPRLIVFDLDFTLWPLWVDSHTSGPPFNANVSEPYKVTDRAGGEIQLYSDAPKVLRFARSLPETRLAIASRSHEPEWARKVISIMSFPGEAINGTGDEDNPFPETPGYRTLASMFDYAEIYPGSKTRHFRSLHSVTGIPYEDMIFFDDEKRNRNVESELGVHFVHVPNGIDMEIFLKALEEFSTRRET